MKNAVICSISSLIALTITMLVILVFGTELEYQTKDMFNILLFKPNQYFQVDQKQLF